MAFLETFLRAARDSALDPQFLYVLMGGVAFAGIAVAAAIAKVDPSTRLGRQMQRFRGTVPALLLMSGITLVVGIEGGLEDWLTENYPVDFTPLVWQIEGNLAERFQDHFRRPWLDAPVVVLYSLGAFLTYHIPFIALVLLGRGKSAMRIAATLGIIWAFGLVCYVFLPVYEVWVTAGPPYHYTHVTNVYFEYVPEARDSDGYRHALNNNWPSLHVAGTAGIATALLLARERWIGWLAAAVAACVAFGTVYLGIHWVVDVIAGFILAFVAAWIVHKKFPREETEWRPWLFLTRAGARAPAVREEEAQ